MPLPKNPYIAGNPVGSDTAFVGRNDVLREVRRILGNPNVNAIVLFGQRRIGKTSILQHLNEQLYAETIYKPVYFDLQDKAAWPLERVLLALAREISHSLSLPDPHDTDFGRDDTFRQVFIPQILNELPSNSSLVLLFDEFDVLDNPSQNQAGTAFFPYVRQLMEMDRRRLQFVFVIGRKPDDLDILTLSVFKMVKSKRVSLLSREDTIQLIHLSKENESLNWTEEAVDEIWRLTNGHPYLTQQLCEIIWNRAYDTEPANIPTITPSQVQAALSETIESSVNALEWLWNGLAPAERVVASVLAQAGSRPIDQSELERLLVDSGVRIVINQLQNAPKILQEWDLIEPVEGGYRFRVELLRWWIAEKKPISRVQQELDRIEPLADSLFQAGQGFYQSGQLEEAVNDLRRSLKINPNHLQSGLLLAQILLEQHELAEAISLLQTIYGYNPGAARPRLVQALLEQAEEVKTEDEQLNIYEQVLDHMPTQLEAAEKRKSIWERRGDAARSKGNLNDALNAYKRVNLTGKVVEIEQQLRAQELAKLKVEAEDWENQQQYYQALEAIRQLTAKFPNEGDWQQIKTRLEEKLKLAETYRQAVEAFEQNDKKLAEKLFTQVITLDYDYEEALEYLLKLTGRKPPQELQTTDSKLNRRRLLAFAILAGVGLMLLLLGVIFSITEYYIKPLQVTQRAELTAQAATAAVVINQLGLEKATLAAMNTTATAQFTNAEEVAATHLVATVAAEATLTEIDAATRVAVAIQGTQLAELRAIEDAAAEATATAEAKPTFTPTPTFTFTPLPTPTSSPTPTSTATPTPTPIPISTSSPTTLPTPNSISGECALETCKYAEAPILIGPERGEDIDKFSVFLWEWADPPLETNEYFDFRVFENQDSEDARVVVSVQNGTSAQININTDYLKCDRVHYWSVRVAYAENGKFLGTRSPESERRPFKWRRGCGSR